jgi:hypothetical protein
MSTARARNRRNDMPNKVAQIQPNDPMIIAPCGFNCSLCRAYIRERQPCPGCRKGDLNKSHACLTCAINNCKELAAGGHQFCFTCAQYPCADLLHVDERYRTQYGVSFIANQERIRAVGVKNFVAEETSKWSCPECGTRLCVHKPQCVNCGYSWRAI